jgi:two-component sensor histidine kinase
VQAASAEVADLIYADLRPTLVLSAEGEILALNPAARRACPALAPGRSLFDFCHDTAGGLRRYLVRCAGSRAALPGAVTFDAAAPARHWRCDGAGIGGDGRRLVLRLRQRPEANENFLALSMKVSALDREIERRTAIQGRLEQALAENQRLLREVHHRVNNNFQTLLSTFVLAARGARSREFLAEMGSTARRVQAMAAAHRMLQATPDLADVDVRAVLREVVETVQRAHDRPEIVIALDVAPIRCDVDVATTLGLLANELLANVYQHAYPDRRPGTVMVALARTAADGYRLVVADDGVDLAAATGGAGNGLAIARALAARLGGTLTLQPGPPKVFAAELPGPHPEALRDTAGTAQAARDQA